MQKNNQPAKQSLIKELFHHTSDISVEEHHLFNTKKKEAMLVVYCNGLIDHHLLINSIFPDIQSTFYHTGLKGLENIKCTVKEPWTSNIESLESILLEKIFNGYTAIIIAEVIYFFNTIDVPKRTPEESNSEVSLRGPRDAFVEDISLNLALVRKRVKSNSLVAEEFTIGKRSKTKVQLIYFTDIQDKPMIRKARERLNKIDIDFLSSDNQLLPIIGGSNYSLFPLMESVSRPDGVVESLARGRFAIFIDNVPNVVVGPANLGYFFNSSEDAYTPYYYATFELALRFVGFMLAIFLPAFWIALSAYNMDQIPFPLLATIAASRLGIPFSPTVELLLMLALFELFREAGVRLPKAVGQTVAVVGGLIVGDAAIRAGFTSPTMLVISAITAVATFTLGNQALYGTVSIFRIATILFASILGMFGFFISLFLTLGYLAKLESFGVPYLSPISPFIKRDVLKSILKKPVVNQNERATILYPNDSDRQGEK